MKKTILIIVGLILIIVGFFGATMKIDTTWHYFGTGTIFGIGLCLLLSSFLCKTSKQV